jgi:uncharacterized protein (DUF2141 family)
MVRTRRAAVAAGLAMALAAAPVVAPAAGTAALTVAVAPVDSADGTVRVDVYRGAAGFREPDRALARRAVPARAGTVEVTVPGLAPGRYAVIVYHDEDDDGELDRFLGMMPTEGYGVSRNPTLTGPPAFEDCAVSLPAGATRIAIEMRY